MPKTLIADEDRPHYTQKALTKNPFYTGVASIWDEEQAFVILGELLDYFGGSDLPPPPRGLPGRSGHVDAGIFDAIQLGASYYRSVIEGRPGRQWDYYRQMEAILRDAWKAGRDAEADRIMNEHVRESGERAHAMRYAEPAPGVAYFIRSEMGPIKIGMAGNAKKRLGNLQTSHPYKLTLEATAPGGRETERAYHDQFAEHRISGEWFSPAPEIEAEIARLNQMEQAA